MSGTRAICPAGRNPVSGGQTNIKIQVLAALFCLLAVQTGVAETAKPYPPPGTPDPGPVCRRNGAPPWVGFFCRFMTVDLWKAAGRPNFTAYDGSHWQPWYYGDQADRGNNLLYEGFAYRPGREGMLEAMLKTDTLPDEYDPAYVQHFWSLFRYTPWSVHVAHEAKCTQGQLADPYALAARQDKDRFPRSSLLGMGWRELAQDDKDPTQGFDSAALPVFMRMAEAGATMDAAPSGHSDRGHGLRQQVNAVAVGEGEPHPDYARDGEVWLMRADGTGMRVEDLDTAASYVIKSGILLTNGGGQSWARGFDLAKMSARNSQRSVVYIYFAQDAFSPVSDNHVYRQRLRYLVDRAARLVKGGKQAFTLVSMGRSAPLAAYAARRAARIAQVIIEPMVDPGAARRFRDAVRDAGQRIKIVAGDDGPLTRIRSVLSADAKSSLCVGSHSVSGEVKEALRHLGTSGHGSQATGR